MSNRVFISGLHSIRRENRATRLVLERRSDEKFGKQVVTVTTSRASEKMELLLSTVVQACSPPPPGRAATHRVSRQYGSPPTPSGPVLHREPRCRLSTAARPSFRADETHDGVFIGEDADDVGAPLDLALERVDGVDFRLVILREGHEGQDISLGFIPERGKLWHLGT